MAVTKIDLSTQAAGAVPAAQMPALTGDAITTAGAVAVTVKAINNTTLSGLGTGILKNTTGTGVPSIAAAGTDYVAPNGNISGTAANLSGTPALPNGVTATTQAANDNSTKLATTAYVATAVAAVTSRSWAFNEAPGGTVNGSNTSFTLANSPFSGNLMLFLNGVCLQPGAGNDYTLSGLTITMLTAPLTGDKLLATYQY